MAIELPYEIWLRILSFSQPKAIRQLRFVNTLFYNLSLDDYHRITQIGYPYPFIDYPPLRDRGNARRVRMLIIRRGPIYPPTSDESSGSRRSRSSWKSIKAKFSRVRQHIIRHKPETIFDKLLDAMSGLTTLTTLDVYLPHSSDDLVCYWTKLGVIKAGWPIFAANLTSLSLHVPLEEIHLVLLSHITLLRLETFYIFLHVFLPTSEPNGLIRNTLLPFLIDHGPTLRSLKLKALDKVDMSSLLASLQHMPCLNSLYISHRLELTSLVGHHQFLEAHQSQLQHLTFDFTVVQPPSVDITDEFFNQEWCRILFPELQFLSFGLRFLRFTVSCEDPTITYIQRHVLTVKSLEVPWLTFSYDQVASILTGPKGGEYRLTKLGTLDLQIWCFSPALLSLLAENTPQLQSLILRVSVIGPDKQPENSRRRNRVPEFCEALQSSYFPEWGLYKLQIWRLHGPPLLPALQNQCKVALLRALPKLKDLCGLGSEES